MAIGDVLRWPEGRGWLVLAGKVDTASHVRARVLARAIIADGGVVYVTIDPTDDSVMADMNDLGAPVGYTLEVMSAPDDIIERHIGEASVIVIEDTNNIDELMAALSGTATAALENAYKRGAVVLAEGWSAHIFGALIVTDNEQVVDGLGWLTNALILPGIQSVAESTQAKQVLIEHPRTVMIGIANGAALALGPDAQVEIWGNQQITLALGGGFGQQ